MGEHRILECRKGYFFEEFTSGDLVHSGGRTVTEADIVNFAALTGDWNSIHTDMVYASQTMFGQRVAHGMLGLSIATALAMRTGILEETILAFREIRGWKFSQPILIGDTIHLEIKIGETRAIPPMGGGIVTLSGELVNQRGETVQRGEWVVLVKSRPAT
jgi:3-hydroxybutyryl-CoA dehydratase